MKLETKQSVSDRFKNIRKQTMTLAQPLQAEDYILQAHPDVSPTKWHMAHTTWFFEKFILIEHLSSYKEFHPDFSYLFNSYYETVGSFHPRQRRGVLSRPSIGEVEAYRAYVDEYMELLLNSAEEEKLKVIEGLIEIGLQHEQQHQELILMDIKFNFFVNPLYPAYTDNNQKSEGNLVDMDFISFNGGLVEIGHNDERFSFDNERPRHKVWVEPYRLATRPVTNSEYIQFIKDDGYQTPEWWLSDGWNKVKKEQWTSPLYWVEKEGEWHHFTLSGLQKVDPDAPVTHVSFYEADAYSRWKGKRLPTEAEWEHAAQSVTIEGNTVEDGFLQPHGQSSGNSHPLQKLFGDVWEWTSSPYTPYPGNKPLEGALGEYNAKFMCNQMVLRGGSCVTPLSHIRETYRNFFPADKRWPFSGIRLAEDDQS
ncbi:ergothioneine biosynthesis protein EgtB [Bacillus salacetis]|uniref:ergothioneine biosynthesis protein EgtB n=1 Tax=Bacillus salacetis TaxID=2315464 RepID=UPI003BA00A1F